MKKQWLIHFGISVLLGLWLVACQEQASSDTASLLVTETAVSATATIIPSQTPDPTSTPTASATATPLPTNTPEPTATPLPTNTPSPTATLLPTSTSVPDTAVPAVTRQSTAERWQNVAEYSFFSPSREREILFTIYTPPGYEQSDQHYPVLYFLHGSQGSHILFWNAVSREVAAANEDAGGWVSQLIETGQLPPFIIVTPNDTDGGWGSTNEAMVTQELIQAIDGNWRTIAARNGRSLAGFSMGAAGAMRYPARQPDLYCNTMLLAESGTHDGPDVWEENQEAVLASGLQVGLAVGELDTRAVNATTAVQQILTELNIPHELQVVPDVPHNFGQLYNEIGLWALQFHAACWE